MRYMPHPPDLTVVICTHNRARLLQQTLSALAQCAIPPQAAIEILVVANNCSDETQRLLEFLRQSEQWHNVPLRWVEEARAGNDRG